MKASLTKGGRLINNQLWKASENNYSKGNNVKIFIYKITIYYNWWQNVWMDEWMNMYRMYNKHRKITWIILNHIKFCNWNIHYSFCDNKYKITTHGWSIGISVKLQTTNYKTMTLTVITTITTTFTFRWEEIECEVEHIQVPSPLSRIYL